MPKRPELAIFVASTDGHDLSLHPCCACARRVTTDTSDYFTPAAHARGRSALLIVAISDLEGPSVNKEYLSSG